MTAGPVVLFDGVCTFCNAMVAFILRHEKRSTLRFAPLQSEPARALLEAAARAGGPGGLLARAEFERLEIPASAIAANEGPSGPSGPSTMVLVEDGRVFTHSTAALRTARYLRAPFCWAAAFLVVPRSFRDAAYGWFGENRYRWFGREESCRIPSPEYKARFLA